MKSDVANGDAGNRGVVAREAARGWGRGILWFSVEQQHKTGTEEQDFLWPTGTKGEKRVCIGWFERGD